MRVRDLGLGDEVAHQGLKERLIRDPCGAEKPHHIAPLAGEIRGSTRPCGGAGTTIGCRSAPVCLRESARQAQPFLQRRTSRNIAWAAAFVEEMAVDQPLFLHAGLDPVAFEVIEALDVVDIVCIKKFMRVYGRFDRRAIARQHVEMRGARKGVDRGLDRVQRGLHQRPLAPAAADTLAGKGDVGIVGKRRLDLAKCAGLARASKWIDM